MTIPRSSAWGLAVASSVLVAACGGPTTVDTASIEKDVASSIGRGANSVDSVDCPKDPVAKVGTQYTCTYTLADGSTGEVTFTVSSKDGTGGWEVSRLATGQVEQEITADYERQTDRKVKAVVCPDPLKRGGNTCRMALRNGATYTVRVRFKGGDFTWRTA